MKIKLVFSAIIICCMGLAACSTAAPGNVDQDDRSVEAKYEDFTSAATKVVNRSVDLAVGQKVVVTLWSNPTTGYSWSEQAAILNCSVVKQLDHQHLAPAGSTVVGAAGSEVWTFQATATGNTTVTVQYGQPWAGGEKAAYTFIMIVTVA